MLKSTNDAYKLLHELDAPHHLLVHVQLVGEAGELILRQCRDLNVADNSLENRHGPDAQARGSAVPLAFTLPFQTTC